MLDLRNATLYIRTLIIEKEDTIPENVHYFKGKRFNQIFIHKDNKHKEQFKVITEPNTTVMGHKFGEYYEYE